MSAYAELKATLNKEQLQASTRLWRNDLSALQVVAGAGSGKTTTLMAAVFAAAESGFSAERLAVITFSRRAAHELRERLERYGLSVGYCGTMHALAWRLIRHGGRKAGAATEGLFATVIRHGGRKAGAATEGLFAPAIRQEKRQPRILTHTARVREKIARGLFPEFSHIPERILLRGGFLSEANAAVLRDRFTEHLHENNWMDFDMMISEASKQKLGTGNFDVVFVDEFQDTSPDQVDFIRSLSAQKIFVVGDDWQSIYRFRGADISQTRNFLSEFNNSDRVYLVQNYRSGKPIVKLGNKIIRRSRYFVRKKLYATHPKYHKPVFFFSPNEDHAGAVWQGFLESIREAKAPKRWPMLNHEKVTVLVRTNAVRLKLEAAKPHNFEIMTIHKSKGLEFDNVIVFGIAKHIIPHRDNDYDEEVRILYVALTRARRFLGFVGWEKNGERSDFLELLMRRCRLVYI